jgi:hypothetical protein
MTEEKKMKARLQVGLIKLSDPRVIRALVIGLTLALAVLSRGTVLACPGGSSGGCSGG